MKFALPLFTALVLGLVFAGIVWVFCAWFAPATLVQPFGFALLGAVVSALGVVAAFDVSKEQTRGEWWKFAARSRKQWAIVVLAFVALVLSLATFIALLPK